MKNRTRLKFKLICFIMMAVAAFMAASLTAVPARAQAPAWAQPQEQTPTPAQQPAAQPEQPAGAQTQAPQNQPTAQQPAVQQEPAAAPKAEPPPQAAEQPPQQQEAVKETKTDGEKKTGDDKEKKDKREGTIYEGRDQFGGSSIIGTSNHIGISVGYLRLPEVPFDTHYLHIAPRVDWHFPKKNFAFSLTVPINLVLYSPDPSVSRWSIRSKDWDSWRDFAQVIRFLTYGRKFDELYINVATQLSSTLGHGFIMRRYIPNVFYDNKKLSLQVDYNHSYAGFESTFSTVLDTPVIGVMPFIRPFAWFTKNEVLSSISIGATLVVDTNTPVTLQRDYATFPEFTTVQNPGWNYYQRFPYGKPMVNSSNNPVIDDGQAVFFYGFDAHVKVYKSKHVDIKPYFDYSKLQGGGQGFTVGCQWRFNVGEKLHSFFNLRTDFRAFSPDYQPSYFDSFYEIQKYQYVIPSRNTDPNYAAGKYPTKYYEIINRTGGYRYGYFLEFNYELSKWFGIGFSIDDSSGSTLTQAVNSKGERINRGNGNFQAHVDIPLPKYFSFHATYHKIAFDGAADIFDFNSPNSIFLATMRVSPFNFVGLYATLQESWELDSWTGLYEMVPSFQAGIDLAYEF